LLSSRIFNQIETLQPNIAPQLANMIKLATEATDPQLLKLCTDYIDAALNLQDWTPPHSPLTDKEQAFIAFTEQFVTSVDTMSDDQVRDLLAFASADEVYSFVSSIYVTDMVRRLELVAGRVLS
jgi:hypothetical protein